jgi:hypothetical protein
MCCNVSIQNKIEFIRQALSVDPLPPPQYQNPLKLVEVSEMAHADRCDIPTVCGNSLHCVC